jgi:hypothetical protein
MSKLLVKVSSEVGHYRIAVYVDREIQPTTVFGCHRGIDPILRALGAAHGEYRSRGPTSESDAGGAPSSITFHLPGDREVAYSLTLPQE